MNVVDLGDSGLKHLFQAAKAGLRSRKDGCTLDADAESGCRNDGILFSMDTNTKVISRPGGVHLSAIGTADTTAV